MVEIGLAFGPAEYFALVVLAFTTITALLGRSLARGLLSLFLGLAIGLVGIDTLSGQSRFTFGVPQLLNGIDVVTVAVGLFAVGETLWVASHMRHDAGEIIPIRGSVWMTRDEWRRSWKPWLRGTALGFPIGSLPAGGAEIPTFLSYALEKRLTKHPEEFGRGAIEGVAGPEAANNASAAGVLAPLLTLGLPTSATAAILLAAFQRYGLNPGPTLFAQDPELVWGLIASLYIGNAMLLVLNLPLAGLWVRMLAIPRPLLYAGILVFAGLGTYSLNNSTVDLVVLYALGVLGFVMRRFDIPVAPAVVGVILGPVAEDHFRRALQIAQGDYATFVTRPISATILALAVIALLGPPICAGSNRVGSGTPLIDQPLPPGFTFRPDPTLCAATERCTWRGRIIRGEVHDENAFALGGASGHAGLFGTMDAVLDFALCAPRRLRPVGRIAERHPHPRIGQAHRRMGRLLSWLARRRRMLVRHHRSYGLHGHRSMGRFRARDCVVAADEPGPSLPPQGQRDLGAAPGNGRAGDHVIRCAAPA